MTEEPTIGTSPDSEEEEHFRAIESDDYEFGASILTSERNAKLKQAARNTLDAMHIQINPRVTT